MTATLQPIHSELHDDPDLGELVELFVGELPAKMRVLRESFAAGRTEDVRRLAHQLRGSAGSYGFDGLTQQAGRVEDALRAGVSHAVLTHEFDALLEIMARVRGMRPRA